MYKLLIKFGLIYPILKSLKLRYWIWSMKSQRYYLFNIRGEKLLSPNKMDWGIGGHKEFYGENNLN